MAKVISDPANAALSLTLEGVEKTFPGTRALETVTLEIAGPTIHGLVGENGAGKSTLGKIISGAIRPDAGNVALDGRRVSYRAPGDALRDGICRVDQELSLVPVLSVLDNVFLGQELTRAGQLDRASARAQYGQVAGQLGLTVAPSARVGTLRLAERQKVEIARALVRNARLIIMDEPTAALARPEADRLLEVMRSLRDAGVTVILISHALEDILGVCETVTVLKDGRLVRTGPTAGETSGTLIESMLGRTLDVTFPERLPTEATAASQPVLRVRGLSRRPAFEDVSFDVSAGEIVGLAGLVGSGRSEIVRAIFGADPADGSVEVDGETLTGRSPARAIRAGLALLPESRQEQGLVMTRSLAENLTMAHIGDVSSRGLLRLGRERAVVREIIERLDIRAAHPAVPVSSLSGGNQQKVALGRWLVRKPRVLLVDDPTRGVDVGAKLAIYRILRRLAAEGIAIVLISSEIEEVLGLADRILVVRRGRIVAEFNSDATDERLLAAAFGGVTESAQPGGIS
jgi:ABC-type sugar transport system ATPase subunit